MPSRKNGFTLVELIVCLSLILLISIPAQYYLKGIILRESLSLSARTLLQELRSLQMKAMISSSTMEVIFSSKDNKCYYLQMTPGSSVFKKVNLPSGVMIQRYSIVRGSTLAYRFGFNPTGSPNSAGTITLSNTNGKSIIFYLMPSTGRMRLENN